jgi:sugar lactone lactonase YvrE
MSERRRWLWRGLGGVLGSLAVYLTLWPTPVDPIAREVPEAPTLAGVYAPNEALRGGTRSIVLGHGPEDVALGPDGMIYTGLFDGRIVRLPPSLDRAETFADTGGRPLGLAFDRDGDLWVADAHRGLLAIDARGTITVLATAAGGVPLRLADELAIAPDGTIWLSDASQRFAVEDYLLDALENRATGRLIAYDPRTGHTRVAVEGLRFANGVAVAKDGSFVLVAETYDYRVTRLWLSGPHAGRVDSLIENLPGFPDNLTLDDDGTLWIGLASRRSAMLDPLLPHPWLRKVVARIPRALQPEPPRYGFVLGVAPDGSVRHNLQDPQGEVFAVTSAVPSGDTLVLGSLHMDAIVRVPRPR